MMSLTSTTYEGNGEGELADNEGYEATTKTCFITKAVLITKTRNKTDEDNTDLRQGDADAK